MDLKTLLLLPAFALNACAINHNFSPEKSLNFEYMQTGDAITDAKGAIYNNDFTLIGFDQRGLIVPGLKNNETGNCNVKRINGMGDVVRSPEHLEQRQRIRQYSEAYNFQILKATSCK